MPAGDDSGRCPVAIADVMSARYQLECPECRKGCRIRRTCGCTDPAHHPELASAAPVGDIGKLGQEALKLVGLGYPVFPLIPESKKPLSEHGFKDATTDPGQIVGWWSSAPHSNIGTPTGLAATFTALDVDVKNGQKGPATLAKLVARYGELPPTAQLRSWSGGTHYLFASTPGVRNSASALGPGLDIRGEDGYIVMPPSVVSLEGKRGEYTWVVPPPELAQMPDWLRELATAPPAPRPIVASEPIPEGRRNETLYRMARSLYAKGLTRDGVLAALREESRQRCEGSFPDDELQAIVDGASRQRHRQDFRGDGRIVVPARSSPLPRSAAERFIVTRGSDITPIDVDWAWDGQLARGKLNILAGVQGGGKSEIVCFEIAAVTTGGEWPDGTGRAPLGDAILFTTEDDPADTIVPRLMLLGADLSRVHFVGAALGENGERTFDLTRDIPTLERLITETGAVYVGIDPVLAHFGALDGNRETEVRSILTPLTSMAARTRVILRGVVHLNKDATKAAVHRVMGATALTAGPRMVHVATRDQDNHSRNLLLPLKTNLAQGGDGLAYALEGWCWRCRIRAGRRCTACNAPSVVKILWEPERVQGITAEEAMAPRPRGEGDGPAAQLLWELVPDEKLVPARDVYREGEARGVTVDQIKHAKARQGVESKRPAPLGPWYFSRPAKSVRGLPPRVAEPESEETF